MRLKASGLLLLAVSLWSGCLDLGSTQGGACVPGRETCRGICTGEPGGARVCVLSTEQGEDGGGSDAAGQADGGPADLSTTDDMRPLLEPHLGCAGGMGYRRGSNMVACPGAFARAQFYLRCGAGWSLCQVALVPSRVCEAGLPGFYAGGAPAAQPNTFPPGAALQCSWTGAMSSWARGIAGCGTSTGGQSYPSGPKSCGGYPTIQLCGAGGWACPANNPPSDSDFSQVSNGNANDGVLCCQ